MTTRRHDDGLLRAARALLACAFSCAPGWAAASAPPSMQGPDAVAQVEGEAEFVTRNFAIPDARAVQADWNAAEEHAAAGRWAEAAAIWQRFLEENGASVLAGELRADARGAQSQQLVHRGAAQAARERLLQMPRAARDAYRARHAATARAALDAARESSDEAALARLALRHPLCDEAVQAWRALGDLAREGGDLERALDCWSRAWALEALAPRGPRGEAEWMRAEKDASSEGARRRAAEGLRWLRSRPRGLDPRRGAALVGEGQAVGPTPNPDAGRTAAAGAVDAGMSRRIAISTSDPLVSTPRNDALWPTVAGELLLVNTGLRLLALSTWTGEVAWDSGEARGFGSAGNAARAERFLGVDRQHVMVGSCVAEGVAVAPLQTFHALLPKQKFNNINITTPLPERRMSGFDLATGRKLWSHEPAADWDGESGSLLERATVAAPPVAVGARVLFPVVRMQGRIDYHVVCVDARDGRLLWSTNLISGQRELNMFGRAEHEFSAAPLVVADGRAYALTQLGAIAALDLESGEILWETLYERIELPRTQDFRAPAFRAVWRNAPPVVADGALLATPFDSRDLVALDLETGALAWSLAHATINRAAGSMGQLDLLVGAQKDCIVLGGQMLAVLDAPQGVATRAPLRVRWSREASDDEDPFTGRPTLARDRVVWPLREGRVELDLATGDDLLQAAWLDRQAAGNLLVLPGALVSLSHTFVQTIFDWEALVARAREAWRAKPGDASATMALARLLDGRATTLARIGRLDEARNLHAEARGLVEALPEEERVAARGVLHLLLRAEARTLAALAEPARAANLLESARALAANDDERRATLLEELELARRMRVDAGGLLGALDELGGAILVRPDLDAPRVDDLELPLAAIADPAADTDGAWTIPARLHVALERLREAEARGDDAACYAALYRMLEEHGELLHAGQPLSRLCALRIARMQSQGRRQGLEAHEARARAALERLGPDAAIDEVEALARRWFGTATALDASARILSIASRDGDLARAAQIVLPSLPPAGDDERSAQALAQLAQVAGKSGAAGYCALLVAQLADERPELQVSFEDGQRTLRQWRDSLPSFGRQDDWDGGADFPGDARRFEAWGGQHEYLGRGVPAEPLPAWPADRPRDALFAQVLDNGGGDLVLRRLLSSDTTAPAWTKRIAQSEIPPATQFGLFGGRYFAAPGRVVLVLKSRAIALSLEDGALAWSAPMQAVGAACADGVLVVREDDGTLRAFAVETGAALWSANAEPGDHAALPLLGARCVASLPAPGKRRVVVHELATGRKRAEFELEATAAANLDRDAWIEAGRLFVPWFNEVRDQSRNQIAVHQLPGGAAVARIGFDSEDGARRVLNHVVSQSGRHWAFLRPWATSNNNPAPQPILVRVDAERAELDAGSTIKLGFEDRVVGMPRFQRLEAAPGPLYLLGVRPGQAQREARVRCLDLERGELWNASIGLPYDEIQHGLQPQPASSPRAVAIALTQYDRKLPTPDFRTRLLWFDPASGLSLGTRDVPAAERGDVPQLVPLGRQLLLRTRNQLEILK
jgi:outer membrane protein assembly factor BamB/tetratricopeptide (TPR) repeat protein